MAQSNVYSLNVVGYVNVRLNNGLTMIANPLDAGNNSISNVLGHLDPNVGYACLTWDGASFQENDLDSIDGTWGNPNFQLAPGTGFFIRAAAGPTTNTFVGNVMQGSLTVPLGTGLKAVASKVPQDGFLGDLGFVGGSGVAILLWDGASFQESDFDDIDGTYTPATGFNVDPNKGAFITNGMGFFFKGGNGNTATWTRNFTVQ